MSKLRSLPPKPSLEFEHKEAKALTRQLRAGNLDALRRARERHKGLNAEKLVFIKLADAQLVIAREYGFTSWPRLVRYFGDVDRQSKRIETGYREMRSLEFYQEDAGRLIARHRNKRAITARELGAYVPRFYGMRVDDIFKAIVSEADAQLVVARRNGCANWNALLERLSIKRNPREDSWNATPLQLASKAMDALNLEELKCVVAENPELLRPAKYESARGDTLMNNALRLERKHGQEAMRSIMHWLETLGFKVQHELNVQLCGHMSMRTEDVRYLLDRGADPNWFAPNGISVLEHAIIRYWNGEAVDLVAARAHKTKLAKRALWISAGLGDVDGVSQFLDKNGKPTLAAREHRPDFNAVSSLAIPAIPEPEDDEVLLEAFFIAVLNGRVGVLDYMISRGFPVDTMLWESPIIVLAVGNGWVSVVECLVRGGADLDLRGSSNGSAREAAREMFVSQSPSAERRRIAELCGVDVEAAIAERNATFQVMT
ncbi:MAG: hypothetical protein ABJB66_21350 [Gemmatimonadaceae bacterium]